MQELDRDLPVPEGFDSKPHGVEHPTGETWNIHRLRSELKEIVSKFPAGILVPDHVYGGWRAGDLQIMVNVIDGKPYEYRLKYFTEDSEIGEYVFTRNLDGKPEEILDWFRAFPQKMSDIFLEYKTQYTEKLLDYNLEEESGKSSHDSNQE